MWPEITIVKSESRRELLLNGEKFTELLEKNGKKLDESLFELQLLNFLQLTNSHEFRNISDEIHKLENLQSLLLFGNSLTLLPKTVEQLSKLKILDVSNNQLTEFNFDLTKMEQLATVNLSNNQITSFSLKSNSVHIIDVSCNKITNFPDFPQSVMDVKMSKNELKEIPDDLQLPNLKNFDMSGNQITGIPKTFAVLKLKTLNMKQNPLKDRKLYKFIDQNQAINAIMSHISKLGLSPSSDSQKTSEKKSKETVVAVKSNQIVIKKFDESFKIFYDPSVKDVRSFILCCIISNVELSAPALKEFLTHQTKLHDGICKKRELATIATHDFDQISSKTLRYAAKLKDDINIMPLGRHKTITANEYYSNLKAEAEVIRKEKKRANFTGIHKFLHLLDDQESFAFLETETGTTLSLPPLTNSEGTKISPNTKRILVEITSSANAAICIQVMTSLLSKALELNISSVNENVKTLELEQVRIVNSDGNLKSIFPSKIDLQDMENESTQITRV